jgi:hypothetical protein
MYTASGVACAPHSGRPCFGTAHGGVPVVVRIPSPPPRFTGAPPVCGTRLRDVTGHDRLGRTRLPFVPPLGPAPVPEHSLVWIDWAGMCRGCGLARSGAPAGRHPGTGRDDPTAEDAALDLAIHGTVRDELVLRQSAICFRHRIELAAHWKRCASTRWFPFRALSGWMCTRQWLDGARGGYMVNRAGSSPHTYAALFTVLIRLDSRSGPTSSLPTFLAAVHSIWGGASSWSQGGIDARG